MPAINPISQSNQFEFNDSVLATKLGIHHVMMEDN